MIRLKEIVFLALVLLSTSACAITRSDVLECGLPDGSKFILTSKYQWNPISINPHGSSNHHQESFSVTFRPSNSWKKIELNRSVSYVPISDENYRNDMCMSFNIFYMDNSNNNRKFPINHFRELEYMFGNFSWILNQEDKSEIKRAKDEDSEIGEKRHYAVYDAVTEAYKRIYRTKASKNGAPDSMDLSGYNQVAKVKSKTYAEITFETKGAYCEDSPLFSKCPITAVWQSISTDEGKTWTDPIITKDAKIYELGKSILEQSFIARPISINGKKIEAHFPPRN